MHQTLQQLDLSPLCLSILTNYFNSVLNFHFYGFYISLFLFLSGLLAYLVGERKRLLNHQNYCKISYLELLALAPYVAQISDKVKQDDLVIQLGERFFKGPNFSITNSTNNSDNITTAKLNEVIKLTQEITATLKPK